MEILLRILHWFAWATLLYAVLGLLLYVMQRSILYYPTPPIEHGFDTLRIDQLTHEVSVIVANPGQAAALLYFGGNAEAVAISAAPIAENLPSHTIYLMEYPGYGDSTGQPSADSIVSAALTLYQRVAANHEKVDLLGRSLGSGVAMQLARLRAINRIVLATPYDSIVGLAKHRYPVYPISWLLKDHYDSGAIVSEVSAPVLVIGAEQDRVIPLWSTKLLVSRFPREQVTTQWIKGVGHNNLAVNEYYKLIHTFLYET